MQSIDSDQLWHMYPALSEFTVCTHGVAKNKKTRTVKLLNFGTPEIFALIYQNSNKEAKP